MGRFHPGSLLGDLTVGETLGRIERHGYSPRNLVLELAEPLCQGEPEPLIAAVQRFRDQGVGVALDNINADRTSLRFLAYLRPDYLKVDISLTGGVDTNPYNRILMGTLVAMAKRMESKDFELTVTVVEAPGGRRGNRDRVRLAGGHGRSRGAGASFRRSWAGKVGADISYSAQGGF